MKRCLVLFLLVTGAAFAAFTEEAVILRKTMMRADNAIVNLAPGTKVLILESGEKTVTIKVNGKTGTVPWNAFDPVSNTRSMVWSSESPAPAPAHVATPAPAAAPTPTEAPAAPRKAQSMYGKMVEKARDTADAHEKALVHPADEVLDGK